MLEGQRVFSPLREYTFLDLIASSLTFEEVRLYVDGAPYVHHSLYISVEVGRQATPLCVDVEWVSVSSSIQTVLVHPVSIATEEVSIIDVLRSICVAVQRSPKPVEDDVESSLTDSVDLLYCLAILADQFNPIIGLCTGVDGIHDGVASVVMQKAKNVTDFMDGDLQEVNARSILAVVLVVIEVDFSVRRGVRQFASGPIERLRAVPVRL